VNLAIAAGSLGRDMGAGVSASMKGDTALATTIYYSQAQGIFAGSSVEGTIVTHRERDNESYYGRKGITAADILDGSVTRPQDADADELYALFMRVTGGKPS